MNLRELAYTTALVIWLSWCWWKLDAETTKQVETSRTKTTCVLDTTNQWIPISSWCSFFTRMSILNTDIWKRVNSFITNKVKINEKNLKDFNEMIWILEELNGLWLEIDNVTSISWNWEKLLWEAIKDKTTISMNDLNDLKTEIKKKLNQLRSQWKQDSQ